MPVEPRDIRARRNRDAREHQVIAAGIVQVRLHGRREDVERLRAALAALVPAWQGRDRFYLDDNRMTGRRYLSVDVSGIEEA